jgi:16S rRNA (uracil1498-N3)-methyltransferase
MRTIRLYHPEPLPSEGELGLSGDAARHAGTVLRVRPGDSLVLFDGEHSVTSEVVISSKRELRVRIIGPADGPAPSPLRSVLVQGVARGDKMDWLIQKATELGVAAIQPVLMARSQAKMDEEKKHKRQQRWQQQAISACEQSGRIDVPRVLELCPFEQWLAGLEDEPWLMFGDPHEGSSLNALTAPRSGQNVYVVVGPEGGFSPEERSTLAAKAAHGITLGPRVLRTETAGIVLLSLLQHRWGDLN